MVRDGADVAILAFGRMVSKAEDAAEILSLRGIEARVVDMRWVKPLDVAAIKAAAELPLVVTVEGGVVDGGAGEGVLGEMAKMGVAAPTLVLGIDDTFVQQGAPAKLLDELELDGKSIAKAVQARLEELRKG